MLCLKKYNSAFVIMLICVQNLCYVTSEYADYLQCLNRFYEGINHHMRCFAQFGTISTKT